MNSRPEQSPLESYLDRICRRLIFVPARECRETREELRQHLESLAAHAGRSLPPAQAMEEAMKKFGDPKEIGGQLSRQHLRRRRWPAILLRLTLGLALTLLTVGIGYSAVWYFALSRPQERETVPTPISTGPATLAAIQTAQDGYARQIHSVRFQSTQTVHTYYGKIDEGETTNTYEVASKNGKYYSREVKESGFGSKPEEISHTDDVNISDGKTLREVLTEWNGPADSPRARKTHGVSAFLRDNNYKPHDPDEALQYGYKVHDAWIGDVLRRGNPIVEGTVMHPKFGLLTVVRCRNKTPWGTSETVRLWFAPTLGWMAIKTERMEIGAGLPFPTRVITETSAATKVGTLWVTTEGQEKVDVAALAHRQSLLDRPRRFANIAFNDVPDSLFTVQYPAGTHLWTGYGDNTKLSVLRPSGRWEQQSLVNSPGLVSLWPYALAGLLALGAIAGLAVKGIKQRERRLTA